MELRKATMEEELEFLHKTVTDKQIKLVSSLKVDNSVEVIVIKDRGNRDFLEQRVTLEEFNAPARNEIDYDFYQNGNFIVEI